MCPLHEFDLFELRTSASTVWGRVDLFALKVMVPTTHIYCVHCVDLTFLNQHLLCPLHGGKVYLFVLKVTVLTTHIYCIHCMGLTSLNQYLLCPLHGGRVDLFALKVVAPTTHILLCPLYGEGGLCELTFLH